MCKFVHCNSKGMTLWVVLLHKVSVSPPSGVDLSQVFAIFMVLGDPLVKLLVLQIAQSLSSTESSHCKQQVNKKTFSSHNSPVQLSSLSSLPGESTIFRSNVEIMHFCRATAWFLTTSVVTSPAQLHDQYDRAHHKTNLKFTVQLFLLCQLYHVTATGYKQVTSQPLHEKKLRPKRHIVVCWHFCELCLHCFRSTCGVQCYGKDLSWHWERYPSNGRRFRHESDSWYQREQFERVDDRKS